MRIRRLLTAAAAALAGSLVLAWAGMCSDPGRALLDPMLGDTPEQRVASYVAAVARGDQDEAFKSWQARTPRVVDTRRQTTERLMSASLTGTARLDRTEFWWMCCAAAEPVRTREDATFARLWVIADTASGPRTFVFDVSAYDHLPMFDRLPARDWSIVAVHESTPPAIPYTR